MSRRPAITWSERSEHPSRAGSRRRPWPDRSPRPGGRRPERPPGRSSSPGDDPERERDPTAVFGSHVAMAGPPVDRILDEAFDAEPGSRERRDDLAECPRSGELPGLVALGDRQPVDVLRRPAARRLDAAEVVVLGDNKAAILVRVEQ